MVKNGYGERFSEQFSTHSGALYTADLPDEMVDRMLDWDKPLSEQPKVLRALLNSDDEWKAYTAQLSPKSRKLAEDMAVGAKPNTGDEAFKLFKQLDADNPNADHNAIYDVIRKYNPRTTDQDWIMSMMSGSAAPGAGIRGGGGADLYNTLGGGEQAAQRLRVAGIPGMQYLDAGSRGQGGTGTRNFVVFPGEEKKVKILERDGQKISAGKGNQFPVVKAGDVVDGLKVRPETANVSSIKASLENYSVMPGIRSVSIDDFGEPGPVTGNVNKLDKRTRELADAISQSNEITPLIVVYSGSQNYILEGSHRIDALDALGKKKIPVIAVIDEDDPPAFWKGKR